MTVWAKTKIELKIVCACSLTKWEGGHVERSRTFSWFSSRDTLVGLVQTIRLSQRRNLVVLLCRFNFLNIRLLLLLFCLKKKQNPQNGKNRISWEHTAAAARERFVSCETLRDLQQQHRWVADWTFHSTEMMNLLNRISGKKSNLIPYSCAMDDIFMLKFNCINDLFKLRRQQPLPLGLRAKINYSSNYFTLRKSFFFSLFFLILIPAACRLGPPRVVINLSLALSLPWILVFALSHQGRPQLVFFPFLL